MAWVKPQYSKRAVDRAARLVATTAFVRFKEDAEKIDESMEIIDNWRSSHSYPLNVFQMTLRNKVFGIEKNAIVAQRLKRLPAILSKIRRIPTLNLTEMQDIGGCRAVLSSVRRVYALRDLYDHSELRHKRITKLEKDYIQYPRSSGYRGVHLVYGYVGESSTTVYNGLRIEIQIRTRLQHAWATAVETVGTFLHQALKSSEGEDQWLRFLL